MSATREGGLKAAETNKRRYGDDYYIMLGESGGRVKSKKKGFGSNRELARIAGAKGGRVSRRPKVSNES